MLPAVVIDETLRGRWPRYIDVAGYAAEAFVARVRLVGPLGLD